MIINSTTYPPKRVRESEGYSTAPFIKHLYGLFVENGRVPLTVRVPVDFHYVRNLRDGITNATIVFQNDIRPLSVEVFNRVRDKIPSDFQSATAVVEVGFNSGTYNVIDIEFQ